MFRLILCLVFIILRAEAKVPETENPEIRLSFDKNENYTVWKNKPLKIIIEKSNTRYVWCFNKYAKTVGTSKEVEIFVPETEFNGDNNILNIRNVAAEMSTRWGCTVLQEYHGPMLYTYKNCNYTATDLHFNLHVKGARAVILIANNQSLTYLTTNLSVNYDGEANYTYEDGEDFPMDFSCQKAKDNYNEDTLRLEYYNSKGILLFKTKPRAKQPHIFRSVLNSNNDKYYLDCIRAVGDPEREYRYRTTFFKRDLHADAVQNAVILSVNGQKLATSYNNDNSFDYYKFKYIDGEVLTVTCQKMDVNLRGPLYFYAENTINQTLRSDSSSEAVISLNISTSSSDIKNKFVSCGINNTNVQKPNARLLFLSDMQENDVRIRGLPRNNILYQYTNNVDQWTIEYQYCVNDTLHLTCVCNHGFHVNNSPWLSLSNLFQWKFEDETFDTASSRTPNSQVEFSDQPFTKILNATHNGTKIKCIYYTNVVDHNYYITKTAEIILRLEPELVTEPKRDEDTGDNSVPNMYIIPITIGVGVAIAIITMICLVSWRKRTKRANLIENAYDNLSNQNDSPIPAFPSQWDDNYNEPDYAKIDEEVMQENYNYSKDNDKLYTMPYKTQSNTSENHYTEIDDYFKRKPDVLAANWNTAQPSNYNKHSDTLKATASHSSNNACYNNFSDSKQVNENNLPINNGNKNYHNVQKPSKSKSVTFRQMSNDLRNYVPGNFIEGNSRQDDNLIVKPNDDGHDDNMSQNTYMQPAEMHKETKYENHFLQNDKTYNALDSDNAEPYEELGISCKNDFYG